jgi:hypothetical protein
MESAVRFVLCEILFVGGSTLRPGRPFMSTSTSWLTRRVLSVFDGASDAERVNGELWYQIAREQCDELAARHGLVIDQAIGVVAALSPNTRWDMNVLIAEELIANGRNMTYPANTEKAYRILAGESPDDVLGGNKVRSFYANILSGGFDTNVTVDGHAANIARGIRQPIRKATVTHRQYALIRTAYQNAAARREVTPPTMQATTWLAWRASA